MDDAVTIASAFGRPVPAEFTTLRQQADGLRRPLPVTGRDAPASVGKGKEIGAWLARVEAAFLLNPNLTKEEALNQ